MASISIARKNLFHEKLRFLISVSGVAFAVMLMLILLGLYRGWNEKLTRYIEGIDANLWVMQKGAGDMFHSVSLLPNATIDSLASQDNVIQTTPLIGRRVSFDLKGKEVHTLIMGYDTERNVGGPLKIIEGKQVPVENEIIIDEVFAKNKNLKVGDTLEILDREIKIVGLSTGGNLVTFQYSYIPLANSREMFEMQEMTNYVLLSLKNGSDEQKVIQKLEEKFPDITVLTRAEFAEKNKEQITEMFLPIIFVLVVIGSIVGTIVISLTIYTATIEKSREYGVIKAIGAPNRHLYRIIMEQSIIAGLIGYVVGVILDVVVATVSYEFEPAFVTTLALEDLALVLGLVFVMITFSAYIPLKRILSIDPAIVFKS